MATLYVRNVPDTLYKRVQELAEEEHLSINAEVITILDKAIDRTEKKRKSLAAMEHIEQLRSQFRPAEEGEDTLSLLREDRDR